MVENGRAPCGEGPSSGFAMENHNSCRIYKLAHSAIASEEREGIDGSETGAGVGSNAVGSPW